MFLVYFLYLIAISKAQGRFDGKQIDKAITYIEAYNGMNVEMVVYLNDYSQLYNSDSLKTDFDYETLENHQDIPNLRLIITSKDNNQTISRINESNKRSVVVCFDFEYSENLQYIFSAMDSQQLKSNIWLILLSSNFKSNKEVYDKLSDSTFKFSRSSRFSLESQVYVLASIQNTVKLFELYQPCEFRELLLVAIATIGDVDEVNQFLSFIWEKRSNLSNCTLRVGYFDFGSFLTSKSTNRTDLNTSNYGKNTFIINGRLVNGMYGHFFAVLHEKLKFSVNWVHIDDQKFGSYDEETKQWSGVVKMINENQIDTFIMPLSMTSSRSKMIKFTNPLEDASLRLFMQRPSTSASWTTFIDVFSPFYWRTLIGSIFMGSLFIFMIRLTQVQKATNYDKIEILSELLGAFCSTCKPFVALDVNPLVREGNERLISGRIILLVVCVLGMVNFQVYNAGLTATLVNLPWSRTVDSLEDVMNNSRYKLVMVKGSSGEDFLRYEPQYHKLWNNSNQTISSYAEGEANISSDYNKVLLASSPDFEIVSNGYPHLIVGSNIVYRRRMLAYPLSLQSSLAQVFNYQILRIKEGGFKLSWKIKKSKTNMDSVTSAISFNNVIATFALLGLGCTFAIGNTLFEWTYRKFAGRKERSVQVNRDFTVNYHSQIRDGFEFSRRDRIRDYQLLTNKIYSKYEYGNSLIDELMDEILLKMEEMSSLMSSEK